MNKNTHILFLSLILILSISISVAAADIPDVGQFFTDDEKAIVKSGQIITRMYLKNNAKNENTHLTIVLPPLKPWFSTDMIEAEMITDEKAFIPWDLNETSRLNFYNALSAYSKLTGMKYHSRRIQKVQQLILKTHRIEKLSSRTPVNDIVYTSIEPYTKHYFLQEDNKFGELPYMSEVYSDGNDFVMVNTCMQGIFLVTGKKENIFISFFFYSEEDGGFYYYTVNTMRIRLGPVLNRLHPTTFSNRLRAATVHFARLIGLNWDDRLNPWDEEKMVNGEYRTY